MIATWMLYCSLCAAGLSLAAVLVERTLLAGRGPVRFVWIAAVALALLVPAAAFRFATPPNQTEPIVSVSHEVVADQLPAVRTLPVSTPIAATPPSPPRAVDWRAALARLDRPLAIVWVTLSLSVAFNFLGGIVALAWMRRGWKRRTVLGVPVFVSERTGPAVVGVLSPAIVLPEWALTLTPYQLTLMLRHEQEHRRAGDGRLLTVAQLALIVMPWNVALWWQLLRLRVAVELDCDARVLQNADARSYGDLLLEVARPRRGPRLMGATAFAERATQLERRIRVLSRHRLRTSRAARAIASVIALAAVTVAWVAPRPPVPRRTLAPTLAPAPAPTIVEPAAPTPVTPPKVIVRTPVKAFASATADPTATDTRRLVELPLLPRVAINIRLPAAVAPRMPLASCARTNGQEVPALVDSAVARLFAGITISAEQSTVACGIIATLHQEQLLQDQAAASTMQSNQAKRATLVASRDTVLRALLTNDADRATFDTHAAAAAFPSFARGGRGRGGVAPGAPVGMRGVAPESLFAALRSRAALVAGDTMAAGGRGGGGRGAGGRGAAQSSGGGRVGGGGAGGASPVAPARLLEGYFLTLERTRIDATYQRLFEGIVLSTEQESSARAVITKTQQELNALTPPQVPVIFRFNPVSGLLTMQASSAAALLAIVTDDADKAKLEQRILIVPR